MEGSERMLKIYERDGRNTSSNDPKMMEARVFIGNLPAESVTRQAVEQMYKEFGKILGISLHKSYGFVQFDNTESASTAVKATHGKMMSGKRLDVNIATERRKDQPPSSSLSRSGKDRERDRDIGRRRERGGGSRDRDRSRERYRGRYRSPSPSRMEYESRMHQWDRLGPHGSPYPRPPPPPRPLHGRDPYLDPFRDPYYGRPREDPFDRYADRLPPRDYPPPRREPYPPPSKWAGDPYEHFPRPLSPPEMRGRGPPPPTALERRAPVERVGEEGVLDMEIIVVNRPQRDYGEIVKSRLEVIGVRVEIATLSPTVSLADALDSAAQRGLLYCVIITGQHEIHRSVTLTILHGRNPQEHKNMPLDDALGLIDKDFERYCQGVREGRIPPRKPPRDPSKSGVSTLLSKAASGEDLDASQLQSLIEILQEKKQNTAVPRPNDYDFNSQQFAKDDIQRQQADLQAKILSLLGSNAVVPSPSSQTSSSSIPKGHPNNVGGGGGPSGYPSGSYGGAYSAPRGGAEGGASGRGYSGYGGYGGYGY